jgi:flagellar M-ring protein FliF
MGFELFDDAKLGMTEFLQNVNYQRALQGELARTIKRFPEVASARVHVVMAQDSLFVEEEKPATASVVLKMHPGRDLNKKQVQGIVHLVSAGIPGLAPENVTVVDSSGNMLTGLKGLPGQMAGVSTEQLEYQHKLEQLLENRIKTMLETALGPSKATVRLAAEIDFKQQELTEESFVPDNRVIRSEHLLNEKTRRMDPGIQGIPGEPAYNLQAQNPGAATADTPLLASREDQTVNYEVGRVTSHTVKPMGGLTRVSVAVLVDGSYEQVALDEGGFDYKYIARTEDEMAKLTNLVKRAINFNEERGDEVEVVNIPFESTMQALAKETAAEPGWLERMRQYSPSMKNAFAFLLLLLSFLFVIRPLVRWLTSAAPESSELLEQLPKTVEELEKERKPARQQLPNLDRASDFITREKEVSLQLVREWLQEA